LVYLAICIVASIFNAILALFLSTLLRKTSSAMMISYIVLMFLYCLPIAIYFLFWSFTPEGDSSESKLARQQVESLRFLGVASPLMAADSTPMTEVASGSGSARAKLGSWPLVGMYFIVTLSSSVLLLTINTWLFRQRWRLTGRG